MPSLSSVNPPQSCQVVGLVAGEALASGDVCYIKSDGKVWKSNGTAATAPALYDGIYLGSASAAAEEPVTLYKGVNVRYGAGMTPGARAYVSTTAGLIGDAASIGGTVPIGTVIDATRIYFHFPTR